MDKTKIVALHYSTLPTEFCRNVATPIESMIMGQGSTEIAQESTGIDRNKILLVNCITYVQTHSSKSLHLPPCTLLNEQGWLIITILRSWPCNIQAPTCKQHGEAGYLTPTKNSPAQEALTPFFCFLHFYPHSFKAHYQLMSNSLFPHPLQCLLSPFMFLQLCSWWALLRNGLKVANASQKSRYEKVSLFAVQLLITSKVSMEYVQQFVLAACKCLKIKEFETLPLRASTESLLQKFETILRLLPPTNSSNLH